MALEELCDVGNSSSRRSFLLSSKRASLFWSREHSPLGLCDRSFAQLSRESCAHSLSEFLLEEELLTAPKRALPFLGLRSKAQRALNGSLSFATSHKCEAFMLLSSKMEPLQGAPFWSRNCRPLEGNSVEYFPRGKYSPPSFQTPAPRVLRAFELHSELCPVPEIAPPFSERRFRKPRNPTALLAKLPTQVCV